MSEKQTYDDATVYRVKLMRPVKYGRVELLPLPVHEIVGRVLNALVEEYGQDVIDTATPVA